MRELKEIVETLEVIEVLKQDCKRREMIYQCEAKEYAALLDGLPIDAYYHLSYITWDVISSMHKEDLDAQFKYHEKVAVWLGLPKDTFYTIPASAWQDYWEAYKCFN